MDNCVLDTDSILLIVRYVDLAAFRGLLFSCRELYNAISSIKMHMDTDKLEFVKKYNLDIDTIMDWRMKFATLYTDEKYRSCSEDIVVSEIGFKLNLLRQGPVIEIYTIYIPKDPIIYSDISTMRQYTGIKSISYYIDDKKCGKHYEYKISAIEDIPLYELLIYMATYSRDLLHGALVIYNFHDDNTSYILSINLYKYGKMHGISYCSIQAVKGIIVSVKNIYDNGSLVKTIRNRADNIPFKNLSTCIVGKYAIGRFYRNMSGVYVRTYDVNIYDINNSTTVYSSKYKERERISEYPTYKYIEHYTDDLLLTAISIGDTKYKIN